MKRNTHSKDEDRLMQFILLFKEKIRSRDDYGNCYVTITKSDSTVLFSLKDKRMNNVQGFEFKPDKCR